MDLDCPLDLFSASCIPPLHNPIEMVQPFNSDRLPFLVFENGMKKEGARRAVPTPLFFFFSLLVHPSIPLLTSMPPPLASASSQPLFFFAGLSHFRAPRLYPFRLSSILFFHTIETYRSFLQVSNYRVLLLLLLSLFADVHKHTPNAPRTINRSFSSLAFPSRHQSAIPQQKTKSTHNKEEVCGILNHHQKRTGPLSLFTVATGCTK
ncbi:MAG: hypothetical protein JOS17DRAFT_483351 [Linnemannia elongata]|nr:MAG: hypothetical protein JOS17DRAFT_483351 [Linnemannia elongata]